MFKVRSFKQPGTWNCEVVLTGSRGGDMLDTGSEGVGSAVIAP
jgi:hypothetical protein